MPEEIDNFYELLAVDYINGAKMLGFSACAIVEGETDIPFWEKIFSLCDFTPNLNITLWLLLVNCRRWLVKKSQNWNRHILMFGWKI